MQKKEDGQPTAKKMRTGGKNVQNEDKDRICRLSADYTFRTVFSPFHWNGVEQPKMNSGEEMCKKFHAIGFCLDTCNRHHGMINTQEKGRWIKFMRTFISNYNRFKNVPAGHPPVGPRPAGRNNGEG